MGRRRDMGEGRAAGTWRVQSLAGQPGREVQEAAGGVGRKPRDPRWGGGERSQCPLFREMPEATWMP